MSKNRILLAVLLGMTAGTPALAAGFAVQAAGTPPLATAPATAAPAGTPQARRSITIEGRRFSPDAGEFYAVTSPVLNPRLASSCNFMSSYDPYAEEGVLDYMRHFGYTSSDHFYGGPSGMGFSTGLGLGTLRDNAPYGDASTGFRSGLSFGTGGCRASDLAFAAGRHAIARKDRTLTEALDAYERGDFAAARASFEANYKKLGYDLSALMVGRMYLDGQGVPADTAQGIQWLRKVVDARYTPRDRLYFNPQAPGMMSERAEAALTLARIYETGHDVPKDPREARKWYKVAAEAGHAPAVARQGLDYLDGRAGARDPAAAVKHLKRAAEAGYPVAMYELGKLYYHGDDGVAQDLKLAGAWFDAGARAGNASALFAAARMYDRGETVAPDQQRALALYKDAAVKGLPDAQNALATYFYTGEVVPKNLETARKLFNSAAVQAQPDAMFNLAVMSTHGEGGPKDLAAAYVWYTLASKGGHAGAVRALNEVRPLLSPADLAQAEAILQPVATTTQVR